MPRKCDECKFYKSEAVHRNEAIRRLDYCTNAQCTTAQIREMFPDRKGVPLDIAREICNKEGDGIFVYFQPKAETRPSGSVSEPTRRATA